VPSFAAAQPGVDRYFVASDGVRLHYLEAGPRDARTIVLVPGWTMPAWIFTPQIEAFSRDYHVIAFDPRGQGESDAPEYGYDQDRRGQDLAELLARLGTQPVVVLGWSLGVLDTLAYVHRNGEARLAGLVLVDNSVGEEPAPRPRPPRPPGPREPHDIAMAQFVRSMFRIKPPEDYLDRLTEATLHTPERAARELLSYPVPRSYWREAVYAVDRPILYIVRPGFAGQAENLERNHPLTESVVLPGAGHAMFVEDPQGFDAMVLSFIRRRIWP
jgi:microsomal epoxide hydrolase